MASANEIATGALRLIGVVQPGRAPSPADMNAALYALRSMLESWSTQNLNLFQTTTLDFDFIPNQAEYLLGPSPAADWQTTFRPMELDYCYIRYAVGGGVPVETPIKILSDAERASITAKTIQSPIPTTVYYNPTNPDATLIFWPVPTVAYKAVLWVLNPLDGFTDRFAELNFPRGYEQALRYNLAVMLAPEYGRSVKPEVVMVANKSLTDLKSRNQKLSFLRSPDYSKPSARGPSVILDFSRA